MTFFSIKNRQTVRRYALVCVALSGIACHAQTAVRPVTNANQTAPATQTASTFTAPSAADSFAARSAKWRAWVGKYPFGAGNSGNRKRGADFFSEPQIRARLLNLLGEKQFAEVQSDAFLTTPIAEIDNHLVLDFPPNNRISITGERVVIVLSLLDEASYAASINEAGDAVWRHHGTSQTQPPATVLQKLNLS